MVVFIFLAWSILQPTSPNWVGWRPESLCVKIGGQTVCVRQGWRPDSLCIKNTNHKKSFGIAPVSSKARPWLPDRHLSQPWARTIPRLSEAWLPFPLLFYPSHYLLNLPRSGRIYWICLPWPWKLRVTGYEDRPVLKGQEKGAFDPRRESTEWVWVWDWRR